MIDPADIVRLVDGTLPEGRRAEAERRLADDPQLAAEVERQRRVVALVADAAADTELPLTLRERLARQHAAPTLRRRRAWGSRAAAGAVAAVLLAVLVVLPGGGPVGPSVVQAAVLGTRPVEAPAPAPEPGRPALLAQRVDAVPFPAWRRGLDWRAVGRRSDVLRGRRTVTVFYAKDGRRVAYTIVAGRALAEPGGGRVLRSGPLRLVAFEAGGRTAVTWRRRGRTCVLSGAPVPVLVRLAAWRGDGAVPF